MHRMVTMTMARYGIHDQIRLCEHDFEFALCWRGRLAGDIAAAHVDRHRSLC